MRRILFTGILCAGICPLQSQTLPTPLSNIYTRANTYSSYHSDAFSFAGNQAALAKLNTTSAGIYGERRFMLQDLASYELAFALPSASGNFGLKANYSGSSLYNESQISLAYGRSLARVDVGAQFNYYLFKASGYGKAFSINFEAGAILHLNEQFQTGFHIYNPVGSAIGKNHEEKLPVVYSFGMGYDASQKFFIGTVIEKTEDRPVSLTAALQYAFAEKLFVRAGVCTGISALYIGMGFVMNGFRIDVTGSLHQSLGFTPGMMLVYNAPDSQ